jgi:hypothetical protein
MVLRRSGSSPYLGLEVWPIHSRVVFYYDESVYDPTNIKIRPEAVEAGRLYRKAIRLAKAGEFDEAVRSVRAIEATNARLRFNFRNEAFLEIMYLCCEAEQVEKASEIAGEMDGPTFQKRALEVIESLQG